METNKIFPNGFTSWAETHFEIVRFISNYDEDEGGLIGLTAVMQGIGGIYELAVEWADEFEELNKDRDDWDGEWFDKIELFCNQQTTFQNLRVGCAQHLVKNLAC